MRDSIRNDRRAVVGGLGAGLLLGFAPTAEAGGERGRRRVLSGLFTALPSARAIGAAYLRSCADDGLDAATLAAELPAEVTMTALRETVAARVRDDFATARVVNVDGWLLARTEARLCALAYLVA